MVLRARLLFLVGIRKFCHQFMPILTIGSCMTLKGGLIHDIQISLASVGTSLTSVASFLGMNTVASIVSTVGILVTVMTTWICAKCFLSIY